MILLPPSPKVGMFATPKSHRSLRKAAIIHPTITEFEALCQRLGVADKVERYPVLSRYRNCFAKNVYLYIINGFAFLQVDATIVCCWAYNPAAFGGVPTYLRLSNTSGMRITYQMENAANTLDLWLYGSSKVNMYWYYRSHPIANLEETVALALSSAECKIVIGGNLWEPT